MSGCTYWRPIDTAPTDGTEIIARGTHDFAGKTRVPAVAAVFRAGIWWRDNGGSGYVVQFFPTHWIPMGKDAP